MTCPRGASRDSPGKKQVGGRQGAPRFPLPSASIPVVHGPACGPSAPHAPHARPGLHVGVLFSVDSSNTFYGFLSARPGDALMAESSLGVCRAEAGEKGAGHHSSGWCGRGQGVRQGLLLGACQEEGPQVSGLVSGSPLRTRRCCVGEAFRTVQG